jgi:hypothetical protein
MDRKSFFKRALLAVGAAVIPNVFLKGICKSGKWTTAEADEAFSRKLSPGVILPYCEEGPLTLYHQLLEVFEKYPNNTVKTNKFYWAEYDSNGNDFKVIKGPVVDPPKLKPIIFTIRKRQNG